MKIVHGRVGHYYPESNGLPAETAYPTTTLFAPDRGIFGVVHGITGHDPAMRYASRLAATLCEKIIQVSEVIENSQKTKGPEWLRQIVVAGSDKLAEASQEAGNPMGPSKVAVSVTAAHLQSHTLDIAYVGDISVEVVRTDQLVFRNQLHTLGDTQVVPPELRHVLLRALKSSEDVALVDIHRIDVQSGDLVIISNWIANTVVNESNGSWSKYLANFSHNSIEQANQHLSLLIGSADLLARMHIGAAWVIVLVE